MIKFYFGSPGAGKTTYAVYLALKGKKNYRHCVTNFMNSVSGVIYDDMEYLGLYRYPDNTLSISDEAGVKYNNRKYKSLSEYFIYYIKYLRHMKCDGIFLSQSHEDVDITIRRLADELWYLKKIGPFTLARKVKKFVTVNETDYQIIDGYKFESPLWTFLPFIGHKTIEVIYRPKYYKYFDSYDDPRKIPIVPFVDGTVDSQFISKLKN